MATIGKQIFVLKVCMTAIHVVLLSEIDRDHYKYITVIPIERQLREASLQSPISIQLPGQTHPMTLNSTNMAGFSPGHGVYGLQDAQGLETGLFSQMTIGGTRPNSNEAEPRIKFPANFMGLSNSECDDSPRNPPGFLISGPDDETRLKIPANFMTSGTESDHESENARKTNAQLLASKFAKMGGNTGLISLYNGCKMLCFN